MLSTTELRDLSHPSASRTWLALLADWLGIAGLFALAVAAPHPLVWLAVGVLMGRQQLALAILMHDGAHRRLFRSAAWNDTVGQWLLAAPLGFSMHSYKILHLQHHKAPLAPDDPDLSLTGGYPVTRDRFVRRLLRDLVGLSYVKFIRYFLYMARKGRDPSKPRVRASDRPPGWVLPVSVVTLQAALLAVSWAAGRPEAYLLLWLLPAMTVLQVLLRIRGVAEHAGYAPGEDQRLNARTVCNRWQTFFFAPHQVNYHIEHHVYPSIPFFRLPAAHALMRDRGSLPAANVFAGYDDVVRSITT